MNTRQAKWLFASLLVLCMILTACSPQNPPAAKQTPTKTNAPPTASQTATPAPTVTLTSTATPLACLVRPGRIETGSLNTFKPAQEFLVYLPPCYDEEPEQHYPVLYLLHGQTYTDNQWVRLGVPRVLDRLIHSGEAQPFIVVFPDDRYWNLHAGAGFGDRLVDAVVPHIDATYRTIPDRDHRAIGGLSRGAGWALELGLSRWDLFGTIGLHSLAVLQGDASQVRKWIAGIPSSSLPDIFMDIGDNDQELELAQQVEGELNDAGVAHEWHLYSGAHTEKYWSSHVEEYLSWYATQWKGQ
ncbi:MAG: alpha/beta hydrolase [Bacteroidota bacterium]